MSKLMPYETQPTELNTRSEEYACRIAEEALYDLTAAKQNEMLNDVHAILELWRQENPLPLLTFGPWEICMSENSPVGLFLQLWRDKYPPFMERQKENPKNFKRWLAVLILESGRKNYSRDERMEATLILAKHEIDVYKSIAEDSAPYVKGYYYNRKAKASEQRRPHLNERNETVLAEYKKIAAVGQIPTSLNQHISKATGLPHYTVSRALKSLRADNLLHD